MVDEFKDIAEIRARWEQFLRYVDGKPRDVNWYNVPYELRQRSHADIDSLLRFIDYQNNIISDMTSESQTAAQLEATRSLLSRVVKIVRDAHTLVQRYNTPPAAKVVLATVLVEIAAIVTETTSLDVPANTLVLDLPELTYRAKHALLYSNYVTVRDLLAATREDLLRVHGIGPSTVDKILETLKRYGGKG